MKKIFCFLVIIALCSPLISCEARKASAIDVITELKYIGKISGNIYFSRAVEGDERYIDSDMKNMLFYEDKSPQNFAVILSSSVDRPYEVMLIIPEADEDILTLADTARRRLALLTGSDEATPVVTAEFIAYSTVELGIDLKRTLEKIIT